MKNKKADNKIEQNSKTNIERIKMIEKEIENKKKCRKDIDAIEEDFYTINKEFKECIELFLVSFRSKKSNRIFNDMLQKNEHNLNKAANIIADERKIIKRNINDLYSEKTKLEKEEKAKEKE